MMMGMKEGEMSITMNDNLNTHNVLEQIVNMIISRMQGRVELESPLTHMKFIDDRNVHQINSLPGRVERETPLTHENMLSEKDMDCQMNRTCAVGKWS